VSAISADWLDRLSGPGRFWEVSIDYRFLCKAQDAPHVTWLGVTDRTSFLPIAVPRVVPSSTDPAATANYNCKLDQHVRRYAIATYRFARSYENNVLPGSTVNMNGADAGYYFRVHRALDIGSSAGLNWFVGQDFDRFHSVTLTPTIEFSPLAIKHDGPKAHAIKLTLGATAYLQQFNATDFCGKDNQPNAACGSVVPKALGQEVRWRIGVTVDQSLLK
jgi:hypothetical protein